MLLESTPRQRFGANEGRMQRWQKSKHRLTIAFFVNGMGQSEYPPVVIWKSQNPRCFKGVKKESLPVRYYCQSKSWMTGEILHDVLTSLNRSLRAQGRSILLFMDNAGCHPTDLEQKYSNIRVLFLPPNTTSQLQPLDLGIIQNFKLHYRKLLMRFVLAKVEECTSASDVTKSLTVLHAIRWIAQAWSQVGSEVIKKCFRKAGMLTSSFEVVTREATSEDPFLDLDEQDQVTVDEEAQALIDQFQLDNTCSSNDLALFDHDLACCADLSDEHWEENFLSELGPSSSKAVCTESSNVQNDAESESEEEEDLPVPKLRNIPEAVKALEDVCQFLECRGYTQESTETMTLISSLTKLHTLNLTMSSRQSSLLEFFTSK